MKFQIRISSSESNSFATGQLRRDSSMLPFSWARPLLWFAALVLLLTAVGGLRSSPRPVVAVVISGALRTLPECHKTVKKHIVDANPSMDFHFYVYVTVDGEAETSLEAAHR